MLSNDLEQWLLGLPLEEPCDIDGERIYLKVEEEGAELGAILAVAPTDAQISESLRTGFHGALEFDAGLALSEDGALLLNRWLPGAETWADCAEALESLLNQVALWRAAAEPQRQPEPASRAEERIRRAINGER